MKHLSLVILSALLFVSCSRKSETILASPIVIHGVTDFGNVLLGDQIDSVVVLDNSSSANTEPVNFSFAVPFYILSYQPSSCSVLSVPAKTVCNYKIRFSPSVVGQFTSKVSFRGTFANVYGVGIKPGEISVSPLAFNIGTVLAGSVSEFTVRLTNSGNSDILYPNYLSSPELSVKSTNCPTVIRPSFQCVITAQLVPQTTNASFTSYLQITNGGNPTQVSFSGTVKPGPSNGNITFQLNPDVLELTVQSPSVNPVPVLVTTNPITDAFGNFIEDGTPISVSVFNLVLVEDPVNQQRAILYTKDGVVSFTIKAGSQVGVANFSASSETSYGSLELQIKN